MQAKCITRPTEYFCGKKLASKKLEKPININIYTCVL